MSSNAGNGIFYTTLQRRLHWLVVVLLISQYALQRPMKTALAAIERQETLTFLQFVVTTVHTWTGVIIAAIMLWRWQLRRRVVPLGGGTLSPFRQSLVRIHHVGLYVVVVGMAVTGALHYYLGLAVAGQWHAWTKWLLLVLVGVHIAGALSHIGSGNTVLQRMMGRDSLR